MSEFAEKRVRQWMDRARMPAHESIAGSILRFALEHRLASSGRGCALLYLSLTRGCVPTNDISFSFDETRRAWMARAIMEHLAEMWEGTHEGLEAVQRAHPDIWKQSEAARYAWKGEK